MAFSTINFETLRSLTEESEVERSLTEESNRSLTEESNRSLTEESNRSLTEEPEENGSGAPVSKIEEIEHRVIQLLPISDEDRRRAAVSSLTP